MPKRKSQLDLFGEDESKFFKSAVADFPLESIFGKRHHGGSLDGGRLKILRELLDDHPKGITTMAIDRELRKRGEYNMAISTAISDLRKNGYPVEPAKLTGATAKGRRVYLYRRRNQW